MRKKDILSIKPIKTRKKGEIITIQLADEDKYLLINCYKDKILIGRYLMRIEDGKHEAWMNGKWSKKKLSTVFGYDAYYGPYQFVQNAKVDGIQDEGINKVFSKFNRFSNKRNNYIDVVDSKESEYNREQSTNAYYRKIERINALMDLVPCLPDDFEEWCNRVILHNAEFLFYDKKKNSYYCTACKHDHKIDGLKHNKIWECPTTKNKVVVKRRQHEIMIEEHCMVVQNIDEKRSVARHFIIKKRWKDSRDFKEKYEVGFEGGFKAYEEIRLILHKGSKSGDVDIYYGQGWRRDEFEQDWWTAKNGKYFYTGYCYPTGCQEALKNTAYSKLNIHLMAEKGWSLHYNKVMANHYNCAYMEYIVKGNYERLTREVSNCLSNWGGGHYGTTINPSGKTIQEVLGVNLQRAHRLCQNNGGQKYLEWLQYEYETGRNIPEVAIQWLEENKIDPRDLDFIIDRMSPIQVSNYIKRQMKCCKRSISRIFELWKDYLSMATRMKMDITNELIYRPKNLVEAHDDIVLVIEQNDAAIRADELLSKYPLVNDICSKIKVKYEYGNEVYSVVVPKCIEEIILEGKILRHCMDKTERYFERINQRETYILFLRKTENIDTPYYTLEVEPNGTVRQKRTLGDKQNKDIDDAKIFLSEWQKEVQKRITEEDKKLARESRELRISGYHALREKKEKIWNGIHAGELLADVLEADLMEVV